MKKIIFIPLILLVACQNSTEKEQIATEQSIEMIAPESKVIPNQIATFDVSGMMCEKGCGASIRKGLYDAGGVSQVDVRFDELHSEISVHFDDQQTSVEEIIETIAALPKIAYTATLKEIHPI
ncbi:MAG: cation transporter [Brumimicrobium sp.]|nr:cation transporter [Brumimicrobium sp.]